MKQFLLLLLAATAFNFLQAQNVGIGTTTPTLSKLQVQGTGSNTHGLFSDGTSGVSLMTELSRPAIGLNMTYNGGYKFQGNGWGGLFYYLPSSGNLTYYSSTATGTAGGGVTFNSILTMQAGGNIGIGTASPDELLDVNGNMRTTGSVNIDNAAAMLQLKTGGVSTGFFQLSGDDVRTGTNSANNTGKFIIRTNGFDRLFVDSAGNIAIGTTYKVASGYRVSVNGKIMCEELKVQLDGDWPDYVFDNRYNLVPLARLEETVMREKHLPGIPSATQVAAARGVEVGDMQKRLLEKVEELYRYLFDMNKENQQLKSDVEQLKMQRKTGSK